jgi:hypothetical protein
MLFIKEIDKVGIYKTGLHCIFFKPLFATAFLALEHCSSKLIE